MARRLRPNLTATDVANYAPFSGDGVGLYAYSSMATPALVGNVPTAGWSGGLSPSANVIDHPSGVHFAWYRTVLWSPSDIKTFQDRYASSGHNHRFLNPYEFYYLLRHHLGGSNQYRATWVGDTIPRIMATGRTYEVRVAVRNDGWDTWSEEGMYRPGARHRARGRQAGQWRL